MKPRILIVEDEPDALEMIGVNLSDSGMIPVYAADGRRAITLARETKPELIVLDLTLPEIDGLEVCKVLQRDPQTNAIPIVMLSGRAAEIDRVIGLELGASDYITKPFSPRELALRIRNILKRTPAGGSPLMGLEAGGLEIDVALYQVKVNGAPVELTPSEFKLLVALVKNRGRALPRAFLLHEVLGYEDAAHSRTVDTHINRLQKKLGPASRFIGAIRSVGYRFALEE